jgi:predicted Zn-dependent protease with MMP-like domain
METEKFEELVADAIESLPEEFRERLENIDIVVADEPTRYQLQKSDVEKGDTLLGLYEGVPLPDRSAGYTFTMPDKITIFQKPIEAACHNNSEVKTEIQRVVRHEIAHHFGIDDDRLEELGSY